MPELQQTPGNSYQRHVRERIFRVNSKACAQVLVLLDKSNAESDAERERGGGVGGRERGGGERGREGGEEEEGRERERAHLTLTTVSFAIGLAPRQDQQAMSTWTS